MAVVIDLDPLGRARPARRPRQLAQQFALRRALGQSPFKCLDGIAAGLVDQFLAGTALRQVEFDLALGTLRQRLGDQLAFGQLAVEQYALGRRHVFVKLDKEARQHLVFRHVGGVRREEAAVAPISARLE